MSILPLPHNGQELVDWAADVDNRIGYKLGTIKKGWISSSLGDSATKAVNINVSPNTIVDYFDGTKVVSLTLSVSPFLFTQSIHGDSTEGVMYCDTSGNLGFTLLEDNHVMPVGDYIILAKAITRYTGNFGTSFEYIPSMPTNHFLSKYGTYRVYNPKILPAVNFNDFGGKTDELTDVGEQIQRMVYASTAISIVNEKPYSLFLDGVYVFTGITHNKMEFLKVKGESETGTIFRSSDILTPTMRTQNVGHVENVTFHEIKTVQYFETFLDKVTYKTIINAGAPYLCICQGENTYLNKVKLDFTGNIYMGIFVKNWSDVVIKKCKLNPSMSGSAWHNIRIDPPATREHSISITKNKVYKGVTGIFLCGGRSMPTVGALIADNTVKYQTEEAVSMDGFGNSASLCPTICNGVVAAVDNTGLDGRLKITADMLYHDGTTPNTVSTISLRDDWTNFFYSFDDGSGKEGLVLPIYDYDPATNSIILDTVTLASEINIGGMVGVQSGFFNCSIKRNKITGARGILPYSTGYYGRGISAYLNIFNCSIEDNIITGCASGIILLGGLMLSTYRMRTHGNIIQNNHLLECGTLDPIFDLGALALKTIYSDGFMQYGNQILDNTVIGGQKIELHNQKDFKYRAGNSTTPPVEYRYCDSPLPTASEANVGQDFFEIINGAGGVPTSMKKYNCELLAGTYSWV